MRKLAASADRFPATGGPGTPHRSLFLFRSRCRAAEEDVRARLPGASPADAYHVHELSGRAYLSWNPPLFLPRVLRGPQRIPTGRDRSQLRLPLDSGEVCAHWVVESKSELIDFLAHPDRPKETSTMDETNHYSPKLKPKRLRLIFNNSRPSVGQYSQIGNESSRRLVWIHKSAQSNTFSSKNATLQCIYRLYALEKVAPLLGAGSCCINEYRSVGRLMFTNVPAL